jgi:ABC-type transport system involved in multi-copper enzyme maturation permease subunit
MRRTRKALGAEWAKVRNTRAAWVGHGLMLLTVGVTPQLYGLAADASNAYGAIAVASMVALDILAPPVVLVFAASLIATELSRGTLRTILVRPVRRTDVFIAKGLLAAGYAASLVAVVAAASWGLAAVFGTLNGVSSGGELVYANTEMVWSYGIAALSSFPAFMALAAFGLLVSTLAGRPSAAVGGAIIFWVALEIIKYPLRIDRWVFTSYLAAPWEVFRQRAMGFPSPWPEETWLGAGLSLGWAVVLALLAMWHFQLRRV